MFSNNRPKSIKHILLPKELGYEGQELRDFVKKQQDLERDERVAQRNYDKEKREAEQNDKDREATQRAKDFELEKLKLEAKQRDKNREATQNIKDKELEMEKWKFETE